MGEFHRNDEKEVVEPILIRIPDIEEHIVRLQRVQLRNSKLNDLILVPGIQDNRNWVPLTTTLESQAVSNNANSA